MTFTQGATADRKPSGPPMKNLVRGRPRTSVDVRGRPRTKWGVLDFRPKGVIFGLKIAKNEPIWAIFGIFWAFKRYLDTWLGGADLFGAL